MAGPSIRAVTNPAIAGSDTLPGSLSPAGTQTGDMVIAFLWSQGLDQTLLTHTLQSGFTEIRQHAHNDGTTDGRLSVAYKIAPSGSSNVYAPYAVANATAGQNSIGLVVLTAGTFKTSGIVSNSTTQTNNAVPNPPSVTGLNGDLRVFAVGAWHVTTAGSTQATTPTNYAIDAQNANASHVTHLAIASRELLSQVNATEDPAAFGDNVAPNGSAIATVAVLAPVVFTRTILVDGIGGVVSTKLTIRPRTTLIDGAGAIVTSGVAVPGFTVHERSATIGASADIASSPQRVLLRSVVITPTADVTSTALSIRPRASSIDATGSPAVAGMRALVRSAAVSAIAGQAVSAQKIAYGSITLDATDQVAVSRQLSLFRAAVIDAGGAVTVGGMRVLLRTTAFDSLGSLSSVGTTVRPRSTLVNGGAVISTVGEVFHPPAVIERAATVGTTAVVITAGTKLTVFQRSVLFTGRGRTHVGSSAWASNSTKKTICGDTYSFLDNGGVPRWMPGTALALDLSGNPCDPLSDDAILWSVAGAVMRKSAEYGIYFSTSHPGILGLVETNTRIATAAEALAVLNNMSGSGF